MTERFFGLTISALRFFKWYFLALFYSTIFSSIVFLRLSESFGSGMARFVPPAGIAIIWLLSLLVLEADKKRELQGREDFWGGYLFYRYGQQVRYSVLPVPAGSGWSTEETARFAATLQLGLSRRIVERLTGEPVQIAVTMPVADRGSGEIKNFLRMVVRSRFGGMLVNFVHYASFGRTITAHYFTYIRGSYDVWDVIKFVLESPFSFWFWVIPWLLNRYSVIARISNFRDSSFEAIDLETMYSLTRQVIFEETENILRKAGLLTDEIHQILQNNYYNQIRITGSSNVNIMGVTQRAGTALAQSVG